MPVILREMTQFFPQFTLFDNRSKDFSLSNYEPDFRDFFDQIHRTSFFRKKMKNDFVFLDFGNRGEEAGYYNFAGPAKYIVTVQFLPPPTFKKYLH